MLPLDMALPLLARLLLTKFQDRLCRTTIGIYRKFGIIYSSRGSGQIKSETMMHYRPKEPVKLQKGLIHHVIINARHNFIKQQDKDAESLSWHIRVIDHLTQQYP